MNAVLVAALGLRAASIVIIVAAFGCALLQLAGRWALGAEGTYALYAAGCCAGLASDVLLGNWPWVAWDAAATAWFAWKWWKERRKRKDRRKALAGAGAKSRALVADLVRKARESARPSPVLRPSLGGAR